MAEDRINKNDLIAQEAIDAFKLTGGKYNKSRRIIS